MTLSLLPCTAMTTRKSRRKAIPSYKDYDSHQENEELNANESSAENSSSASQYEPE